MKQRCTSSSRRTPGTGQLWFLHINNKYIQKILDECLPSQAAVNTKQPEPLKMTELPNEPRHHLHTDLGPICFYRLDDIPPSNTIQHHLKSKQRITEVEYSRWMQDGESNVIFLSVFWPSNSLSILIDGLDGVWIIWSWWNKHRWTHLR